MDPDRPADDGLRIDPVAVARGATLLLDAAGRLAAIPVAGELPSAPEGGGPGGDGPGGDGPGRGVAADAGGSAPDLRLAVARAADALAAALDGLGEVLRTDADRLYLVAAASASADGRAEERLGAPAAGLSRTRP
jgi:hypothetical protein